MEDRGYPSIAKLAFDREWWAVQGLCRRGLVSKAEARKKWDGRNALEWAIDYADTHMVEELRYFLVKIHSESHFRLERYSTFLNPET